MRHIYIHATVADAWDYKAKGDRTNPPVIRLAWIIDDAEVGVIEQRCEVFSIPATQVLNDSFEPRHNITRAYLELFGIDPAPIIGMISNECRDHSRLVGYGVRFIRYAIDRERANIGMDPLSWEAPIDVMELAAPVVNAGRTTYGRAPFAKWTAACAHFGLPFPEPDHDPVDAGVGHVLNLREIYQRLRHRQMPGQETAP